MPLTTVQSGMMDSDAQYTGFKNRIINGAMRIDQRGAVNVTAAGANTYVACDRFTLTNYWGSGQVNTAKSTTIFPSGFSNSVSLTVATPAPMSGSTGYSANLWQSIEGFNIADAYVGSITLSFWVRSSIAGTYSITFCNVNAVSIDAASRLYVSNYTINAANTWEQKTITVNLATGVASGTWNSTNGTGLCVIWNLGAESNRKGDAYLNTWGTLGSTLNLQSASQVNWISTNGATFYLTGVQVEKGVTATSFDYRPYTTELQLCQRYCWQDPNGVGGSGYIVTGGLSSVVYVALPVTMRVAPAFTNITNGAIDSYLSSYATTGCTLNTTSTSYVRLLPTTAASLGGAGVGSVLRQQVIRLDSEL
jgi:hypothetical protein